MSKQSAKQVEELSSRFDENDTIFIMDKVFVPWEDILVYKDTEKVRGFLASSGFSPNAFFHSAVRFTVKLDFLVGLMLKCVDIVGSGKFRSVHAQLGEMVAWRNVCHSLVESMIERPTPWLNGAVLPNADYSMTFRALSPMIYSGLFSLNMLYWTKGKQFKKTELISLFEACGFEEATVTEIYAKYSLIRARKPSSSK